MLLWKTKSSLYRRSIERVGGRAGRGAEWAGAATADAESNVGEAWVSMGMNVFVHPGVSHPVVCPRGWEWVVGLPGGVMDEL